MITWFKGFFEAGSAQSSKRLMGIMGGFALFFVCIIDSFHFFEVHEWVGYTLAGYSAGCLGITAVEKVKGFLPGKKEEVTE